MKKLVLIISALMMAGCSSAPWKKARTCCPCPVPGAAAPGAAVPPAAAPKAPEVPPVIPVAAADLPVFSDGDDKARLIKAAALNQQYFDNLKTEVPVYTFGSRKVTSKDLAAANREFKTLIETVQDPAELDRKIKERFDIYQMSGRDSTGTVVFSSYYEPTLEASLKYTDKYKFPIYAKPDDLITVNLEDFSDKFKGEKITGRVQKGALVPYMSRDEIDFQGGLEGKGLEIAWLTNLPDIMDLHIEGSGRLQLPDGRIIKANFAGTNSLKFKGWMTALIEMGLLPREGLSHEKAKQYLAEHPEKEREVMSSNKRYTFFKLNEPADPEVGPDGTYGLPLTGWRSVAVDNSLVPMGAIGYMRANTPDVNDQGDLLGRKTDSRFVFFQDTGGAIKGPGRIDFFAGNGKKARTFAFKLWDQGQMYILLLKEGAHI